MTSSRFTSSRGLLLACLSVVAVLLASVFVVDAAAQEATEGFDWEDLGAKTFATNCMACHQQEGQGVPGAFPNLAGHLPSIVAQDGGRDLLPKIVVFGMQGAITVDGSDYDGLMPAWKHLSDEEIAATINHELTSWGNADLLPDGFALYAPDDIAAARETVLTNDEVYELRQSVMAQAD